MLLNQDNSCLVLIDVQDKLTPHVQNSKNLIARCEWMLRLATELDVPKVLSEQYPSGLGHTVEPLRCFGKAMDKVYFSCWRDAAFAKHVQELKKTQIVLMGIETHVCVLQTAMDMSNAGIDVFVVVNAVNPLGEIGVFGLYVKN